MDDKQFDRLLKGKLESFHDTGPVDEAGMGNVFSRVDALNKGKPWYQVYKPYLVAAGVSLLVISSAFALWLYQRQDARIEALEKEVVVLKENSTQDKTSKTNLSPDPVNALPETSLDLPVIHPQTYAYQSVYTSDSSHKKNNADRSQTASVVFNQVSLTKETANLRSLPVADYRLQPNAPLSLRISAASLPPLPASPELSPEKTDITFASRLSVGIVSSLLKSTPDIGKAQAGLSPGLGLEFRLSDHFRVNVSSGFVRRRYSVEKPERFRPQLGPYPRLPNLNETSVAEIQVVSRMVRVPVELTYSFGNPGQRLRPYTGAGLVGNMQFSQNFSYRRGGNDFHPGARIDKKTFGFTSIIYHAGAEIGLHENVSARLGLFYEQPLKGQGAEQRKFSTVGLTASVWFSGS
ncbi:MAG: outer membrane beta-barrel protein [Bacteroidia bacterium]|nr:outer membrane beta-barrel protein [Bacteroidia bacterium]